LEYVVEQALALGIPVPAVDAFAAAMERAVGAPIADLADAAREFVRQNEARLASRAVPGPESIPEESVDSAELKGYLMQSIERGERQKAPSPPSASVETRSLGTLWLALAVLGVLGAWRWRHRSRA